jgi:hypothetical protein
MPNRYQHQTALLALNASVADLVKRIGGVEQGLLRKSATTHFGNVKDWEACLLESPVVPNEFDQAAHAPRDNWQTILKGLESAISALAEIRAALDWTVGGNNLLTFESWRAKQALAEQEVRATTLGAAFADSVELAWSLLLHLLVAHEEGRTLSAEQLAEAMGCEDESQWLVLTRLIDEGWVWRAENLPQIGHAPLCLTPRSIQTLRRCLLQGQ